MILNFLNRLVRDEQGQDLIEYALLATFVSLVAITGATALGDRAEHLVPERVWHGGFRRSLSELTLSFQVGRTCGFARLLKACGTACVGSFSTTRARISIEYACSRPSSGLRGSSRFRSSHRR